MWAKFVTWVKAKVANTRAFLKSVTDPILAFPAKFLKLIHAFFDGLIAQVATAKGAIILGIILLVIYDVIKAGKAEMIKFVFTTVIGFIKEFFEVVKAVGIGQLVIVALVIFAYFELKKLTKK